MSTNNTSRAHAPAHTQQPSLAVSHCGHPSRVDADIVIPVYNEEDALPSAVDALISHLEAMGNAPAAFSWNIVIADNASTDSTWELAQRLSTGHPGLVRAVHINRKGRGLALKTTWGESLARVVSYMDVDLSTDIRHTGTLIGSLLAGGADVAIGSRLLADSDVTRSTKREFISRCYNIMLRSYLDASFHDAQCGFKAMTSAAAHRLLPVIEDDEWFFDTELLVRAEHMGLRLYEIPVRWVEDRGTTVNIPDTVAKDLAGMRRMKRTFAADAPARERRRLSGAWSSIGWDGQGQQELRGSLIELADVKAGA